jgi:hypothetical protein
MVPSDHQYNNLVVDQKLLVKQSFASPLVQANELVVSGSASFQALTINGQPINQLISQIISSDVKIPSFDTTNIVSTNITTTNLDSTNATIVNLSVTDLTGANIIAVNLMASDVKTTTLSSTSLSSGSALLTDLVNQLVLGVGNTLTLNAPAPAASHIYSLPDVLADASFVMTEGAQTINGIKTFTSAPVFPALSLPFITLTNVTNQVVLGTGNTITLNAPAPAASRVYSLPDVLANADVVLTAGTQTIGGAKTFSSTITDTALTNQLILGAATNITLTAPAPAASRVYTIPDVLSAASFVMTAGTQTIAGAKTFSTSITLPTSGGTATALTYYEQFTSTVTFQGPFNGGNQTVDIQITRIGNMVTVNLNGVVATGNGVSSGIASVSAPFPARFQPATLKAFVSAVQDNGQTISGLIFVTGGSFSISRGIVTGADVRLLPGLFTGTVAQTIGFSDRSMSWLV